MNASARLSRRTLAVFIADAYQSGTLQSALNQVAAYLIETKKTAVAALLIRDVEDILSEKSIIVADVASARPLSKEDKATISRIFNAKELHIREEVDEALLGGLKVEAAGKRLDATLRQRLETLKRIES